MDKVLMVKGNMVHYVSYCLVDEFISYGWKKADLTEKKIEKIDTKSTTKKSKKAKQGGE